MMDHTETFVQKIAKEFSLSPVNVSGAIKLLFEEDCTIPFVARYRKEVTGSMDEVNLRNVRDRWSYLTDLQTTKEKYLKVVKEHCDTKPEFKGKFDSIKAKFEGAETKQQLEDLYLPFKPKRRTRAQMAKEMGLYGLYEKIMAERATLSGLSELGKDYITPSDKVVDDPKLVVTSAEKALAGAGDILAENISENAELRELVRKISFESAVLTSKKIEYEKGKNPPKNYHKYENYFEYSESISKTVSHRVMAIRRGEAEKCLRVSIEVNDDLILDELYEKVIAASPTSKEVADWMAKVLEDAYKRLLSPSIETEIRLHLKNFAETEAINVFSENLENLLLLPPIPDKVVLGVDPGLRTGSKLAVVDATGKVLEHATVYPDPRKEDSPKSKEAKKVISKLIKTHGVQYLAIGNGTGSREIDQLVISVIKEEGFENIRRLVVNEAGASVYSTDEIAREEFPDLDPTIRSAISIARRLQDPLAELVKIDPRSIGVGQYQHDCNLVKLNRSLGETVESCVNRVGVNVNTASYKLLGYVSGVSSTLAKNIVKFRNENGPFASRGALAKVSGFGPKSFEQAAGFLRVPGADNPLDNTGVHPESYEIVDSIIKDLRKELAEVIGNKSLVDTVNWEKYVSDTVGLPTLLDIGEDLSKPGRDPREDGTRLTFSDEVSDISDLKLDMRLKGTVTNVTNFGAFVDIGVHQDGLVHVSELSDNFVSNPADVVSVGKVVDATVIGIDTKKNRISLSLKTGRTTKQVNGASPANKDASRSSSRPSPRASGRHNQRPAKPKGKQENFSVEDLLSKFNSF